MRRDDPLDEVTTAILRELASCAALRAEARAELRRPERNPRVLGSITHDFYNCCERVFRRIGAEINGASYRGEAWHKELLFRMTVAVPGVRPRVISDELAAELDEYLSFRHVFRNVYGSVLDPARMQSLEEQMPATLAAFRDQIEAFLAWMLGQLRV